MLLPGHNWVLQFKVQGSGVTAVAVLSIAGLVICCVGEGLLRVLSMRSPQLVDEHW